MRILIKDIVNKESESAELRRIADQVGTSTQMLTTERAESGRLRQAAGGLGAARHSDSFCSTQRAFSRMKASTSAIGV